MSFSPFPHHREALRVQSHDFRREGMPLTELPLATIIQSRAFESNRSAPKACEGSPGVLHPETSDQRSKDRFGLNLWLSQVPVLTCDIRYNQVNKKLPAIGDHNVTIIS